MARCVSCRAPIVWVTSSTTGRPVPLDAEPTADGNVVLRDGQAVVLGKAGLAELPADAPRFRSHFATCPHAGQWRAPRKEPARG